MSRGVCFTPVQVPKDCNADGNAPNRKEATMSAKARGGRWALDVGQENKIVNLNSLVSREQVHLLHEAG